MTAVSWAACPSGRRDAWGRAGTVSAVRRVGAGLHPGAEGEELVPTGWLVAFGRPLVERVEVLADQSGVR